MATVRFSKELIENIERNARAKMQPMIDKAKASRPDDSWAPRIYDILFGDVKPALTAVPSEWLNFTGSVTIDKVAGTRISLEFKFPARVAWPNSFPDNLKTLATPTYSYYNDKLDLKDHPAWADFKAEVDAYHQRVQSAINRQIEFVSMVRKVVESFSTLAPALKAWPPLWDLIPEDVKTKHKQIVEREKKETKVEVDLGKLTALSTAAKFGI